MCEALDDVRRLKQIPHLHVRGSNYEVGFAIGRTFKSFIEDFLDQYSYYEEVILPVYESTEGKNSYDVLLNICRERFPNYIQEIQGMADGAKLPFHQLFLLHIDGLLIPYEPDDSDDDEKNGNEKIKRASDDGCKGCTSVLSHGKEIVVGHTEDALREMMNNYYIVSAEVTADDGVTLLEKFTTLTYPGYLCGGTMGFNNHGIVHTINSIFPKETFPNRTPHLFIMRALLGAKNFVEVVEVLRDNGSGTADGFNLNVVFAKGDVPAVYSIEVSPNQQNKPESELFFEEIKKGDSYSHCNQYLRCKTPEKVWYTSSSFERHQTIKKFEKPYDVKVVQNILSEEVADGEDKVKYSIFKRALNPDDHYATISVGIFDLAAKQWCLYTHPPKCSRPVAIIPINFDSEESTNL